MTHTNIHELDTHMKWMIYDTQHDLRYELLICTEMQLGAVILAHSLLASGPSELAIGSFSTLKQRMKDFVLPLMPVSFRWITIECDCSLSE